LNPASTQTQEQQRAATSQQTRNAQATAQSVENTYIPD
jgi:hypothetical protein